MKHSLSFKNLLKWLWTLLVLAFVVYYLINNRETLQASLVHLSWKTLLLALSVITVAKLLLTTNMLFALQKAGYTTSFRYCFNTYNLTQLAKYIPGSIWQFVGRVALLREKGVSATQIRDSMLAEHLWVLASAMLIGLLGVLLAGQSALILEVDMVFMQLAGWLVASGAVALLVLLFIPPGKRLLRWLLLLRPGAKEVFNLGLVWVLLGFAFWVVLQDLQQQPVSLLYIIGLYALAYLVGFLVPFAPAGLGVREAILVFGLSSFVGVDVAILLAGINRVLYFFSEILLGILIIAYQNHLAK